MKVPGIYQNKYCCEKTKQSRKLKGKGEKAKILRLETKSPQNSTIDPETGINQAAVAPSRDITKKGKQPTKDN
jgi:hypothetical protein